MALLRIVRFPDPILKKKTSHVMDFNSTLEKLTQDMLETMYDAPGVGLAANQIGVSLAVAVIDVSDKADNPMIFVNPKILKTSGEILFAEGCLSIPGFTEKVKRASEVSVQYQDLKGMSQELHASGLLAVALQHETDHLQGKLYIDRLSSLKRSLIKNKITKTNKLEG